MHNRQIRYVKRPARALQVDSFELTEGEIPVAGEGHVLVRTLLVSIDPANRAWMQGATYRAQLNEGDVMAGYGLGQVVDGSADLAAGTIVAGDLGWQELRRPAAVRARGTRRRRRADPLPQHPGDHGSHRLFRTA